MTQRQKQAILVWSGCLAGLTAWPFTEALLRLQIYFPSFLIFSIVIGMVFGVVMGAIFGSGEGLCIGQRDRLKKGVLYGVLLGLPGGILAYLAAQAVLLVLGETLLHSTASFETLGLPAARALGWSVLGVFLGSMEGIRTRSRARVRIGLLGGFAGGLIAGLALEYLQTLSGMPALSRLAALVLFGCSLGLAYSLLEAHFSLGTLRLLNGRQKGKEYLLLETGVLLGSAPGCDIELPAYADVAQRHARVFLSKDEVCIEQAQTAAVLKVNDETVRSSVLKLGDVLQVGSARLLYYFT
ncbi:MAG: hypothetical protein KDK39_02105 [Leptospiraceae bacterium]|nr:hypothetical protein [Leptospiraceae bacterium]